MTSERSAANRTTEPRQQAQRYSPSSRSQRTQHAFYQALDRLLLAGNFDQFIRQAAHLEQLPALEGAVPLRVYFRMLLVGYFEGLDSFETICRRCADSRSLQAFLDPRNDSMLPDAGALGRMHHQVPAKLQAEVFDFARKLIAGSQTLHTTDGGPQGEVALRSIMRHDDLAGGLEYLHALRREALPAHESVPETTPRPSTARRGDGTKCLWLIAEQSLVAFSAWTLAYHLCFLAGWPAWRLYPAAAVFYVVLCLLIRPRIVAAARSLRRAPGPVAATLLTGLVAALYVTSFHYANGDDMSYFHRALVQLDRLNEPILRYNTVHNAEGLPHLSIMMALTSFEMLMALAARAVGADPLWCCQHAGGAIAAILLPVVYGLLFRRFRIRGYLAVAATWAVLIIFFLDGNTNWSFGYYGLVHLHIGKAFMISVLVPFAWLCALRCLAVPQPRRLLTLALCGVSAVGLTGSGIFMFPLLVAAAAAAYVLGYGMTGQRLMKAVLVNLGSLYCVAVAAGIASGYLPPPKDTSVWSTFPDPDWWLNLLFILENRAIILRDAAILLLPVVALPALRARFVLLYSLVLVVAFVNPVSGPIVMEIVQPVAFNRLLYLFPLGFCCGLLAACIPHTPREWASARRLWARTRVLGAVALRFLQGVARWVKFVALEIGLSSVAHYMFPRPDLRRLREEARRQREHDVLLVPRDRTLLLRLVSVVIVVGLTLRGVEHTLRTVHLKSPLAHNLPDDMYAFSKLASPRLPQGANVLAPIMFQWVPALLRPDLRFDAEFGTPHILLNAGRPEEAHQRMLSALVIGAVVPGVSQAEATGALQGSIDRGVRFVICPVVVKPRLVYWLNKLSVPWQEQAADKNFALIGVTPDDAVKDPPSKPAE